MINDFIMRGVYSDLINEFYLVALFCYQFSCQLFTSEYTYFNKDYYSILKLLYELCLQCPQTEVQDCMFTSEIVLKSSQSFSFPTSSSQSILRFTGKVAKFFYFFVFLKYWSYIKQGNILHQNINTQINFMKAFAKLRRIQSIGIYCFISCQSQIFCVRSYW